MIGLLPLIPLLAALPETVDDARVAQVRLAESLAEADAIDGVVARGREITFTIVRDHETLEVTARTAKRGEIVALKISAAPPSRASASIAAPRCRATASSTAPLCQAPAVGTTPASPSESHALTWLGTELAEVTAITRLAVDRHGAVTLTTSDGRHYLALSGHGHPNVASEARWAATWSR